MNKKKLGRGLGELLGDALDDKGKILELSIDSISPNPWQPRKDFDEESLQALADSIKENGLIQPVVVRQKGTSLSYELAAGERRWRAARMAGLTVIPAIAVDYDDRSMAEMALVENLQRKDLNPVDEGMAYQKLMDEYGLTQEQISEKVGRSRPYVANMVRLLDLPDEVKGLLAKGALTAGQARPLLALGSGAEKVQLARRIVKEGLSARKVEEIIRQGKDTKPKDPPPPAYAFMKAVEEKLGLAVGSKVRVKIGKGKNAHKGTISISFRNDEEFQRIADILNQSQKDR
ncbi:ParB/RepB/Spo0J family partition protein [uncultured Dialister sp.]|uniref:ParB/RepB/Spo0J family partition protein n=1 Tax=uncultured Dialister sp. TaxID=278064 RepID=UPI0026289554|nr:ParB/RepB/Spo0J family partition protein [uncultured Dialister sp.]